MRPPDTWQCSNRGRRRAAPATRPWRGGRPEACDVLWLSVVAKMPGWRGNVPSGGARERLASDSELRKPVPTGLWGPPPRPLRVRIN